MIRDVHNIIPVTLAVLVHAVLFGGLFVALDFSGPAMPAMPLAMTATLVTDNAVSIPPPVVERPPPPVEKVPPDNSEQLRKEAEEQKRLEDVRLEEQRLSRIAEAEAEKKRVADEAERNRVAADAEKKRLADEADKERKLREAEAQRQADIQRQRDENERLRVAEAAALRQTELQVESDRIAAMNSNEMAAYLFALQQRVRRNWVAPASAKPGLECKVRIRQLPGGEVINATIMSCNGDAAVQRSIEAAVHKASPLPTPSNPILFDPDLVFEFKPET
jgi:colicin import membrane protein